MERNRMKHLLGRAVVVGGGIGGIAAAGALAPYFREVEVFDRDDLPASPGSRAGTPQDRHSHGLLAGGLKALGEIYPGFQADLAGAGAVPVRVAQDVRFERQDIGVLPQRDFGRSILCASRPLIEHVLRQRAEALPNVQLRRGCRVTEILAAGYGKATPAVRFSAKAGSPITRHADLVVDASGRGTLTLALLDALGWAPPAITEVGVDIAYATAVVSTPPDAPAGWKLGLTYGAPPFDARHAVFVPIEGQRWTVTIGELHGKGRLDSWDAFLEQGLGRLHTRSFYDALRRAEPPDEIRQYVFQASQWRHFEQLPRLPHGILPLGDALCRFNPIHGQGMSSAAKQAGLLRDVLERLPNTLDPIPAVQARMMAGVAEILQTPWAMSTTADFAYPATRGERPEHFEEGQAFETALLRTAIVDPVVHRTMVDVMQLLAPIGVLHEPEIQRRIEAASARAAA
jgi:2-polyprenyl-6-methoxyphenol hydroxylase-like FAD-dependent oxidoreductase